MSFTKARITAVNVNPALYHQPQKANRGEIEYVMSPSSLKLFGECASRWKDGFEHSATEATQWGNLVDTLALTPSLFEDRYITRPDTYKDEKGTVKPWHHASNTCRAWLDEARAQKLEVISREENIEASQAVLKLRADPAIASFLDASEKQVALAGVWQDKDTGLKIPVRCLLDAVPAGDSEYGNSLGDLKSTRNAGLSAFQRDAYKNGYHIQAAFDLDLFNAATGQQRNEWRLVLLENVAPFQSGKRLLTDNEQDPANFIELGRYMYKKLLANYCVCLKTGVFPGYDDHDESIEGWSVLHAEPWMSDAALFAPKFQLPESRQKENTPELGEVTP